MSSFSALKFILRVAAKGHCGLYGLYVGGHLDQVINSAGKKGEFWECEESNAARHGEREWERHRKIHSSWMTIHFEFWKQESGKNPLQMVQIYIHFSGLGQGSPVP